jgi:arginine/lysine/ornithine decarboxylase
MASGADMSVQSLHKTIPALTMASQIHISEEAFKTGRISGERVIEMLGVFETSSPSFLIAASSEYAISWMDLYGRGALRDRIRETGDFKRKVLMTGNGVFSFPESAFFRDPLRIVLRVDPGAVSMTDLIWTMENAGIAVEFADLTRLVLIVSPWQKEEDFDALLRVLSSCRIGKCARRMPGTESRPNGCGRTS